MTTETACAGNGSAADRISVVSGPSLHRPITHTELVVSALARWPAREAFRQDGRAWSYAETADLVSRFAALFQQLSLLCDQSPAALCGAGKAFSQPLVRFPDAMYFSTVTLSTAARDRSSSHAA